MSPARGSAKNTAREAKKRKESETERGWWRERQDEASAWRSKEELENKIDRSLVVLGDDTTDDEVLDLEGERSERSSKSVHSGNHCDIHDFVFPPPDPRDQSADARMRVKRESEGDAKIPGSCPRRFGRSSNPSATSTRRTPRCTRRRRGSEHTCRRWRTRLGKRAPWRSRRSTLCGANPNPSRALHRRVAGPSLEPLVCCFVRRTYTDNKRFHLRLTGSPNRHSAREQGKKGRKPRVSERVDRGTEASAQGVCQ